MDGAPGDLQAPLGYLSPQAFLERYWQREACVIRGALPDFVSPLEGDDLAGLACDPLAESRIIQGPDDAGQWQLRHGPFTGADFDGIGERNWTLLVQDVEKHYAPLQGLLDRFAFLPSWRLDDLMISFAAPGGSVGAHVDQYDVFLLQAEGRRHWEIAAKGPWQTRPDVPIDMLEDFKAEQSWTLEPGDMLYLPPGVAHHGTALDACLTYSIGFRAPSAADLAMALGEWLAERDDDGGRFRDPALQPWPAAGEISEPAREAFRALLADALDDDAAFGEFLAAFMSRFRQAHEPVAPPDADATATAPAALRKALSQGATLHRHPWARASWVAVAPDQARLYLSGQAVRCSAALARAVCGSSPLALPGSLDDTDLEALGALLMGGQLIRED